MLATGQLAQQLETSSHQPRCRVDLICKCFYPHGDIVASKMCPVVECIGDCGLTMQAVRDVVVNFRMPGHGMPGFERFAAQMAIGEVYNLRIHHDDVLVPVLRFWNIFDRNDFGPVGEQAREELIGFLGLLDERARFYEEKRKLATVSG